MPRAEIKILSVRCKVLSVAGAADTFRVRIVGQCMFGGRALCGGDTLGGVTLPHECVIVEVATDPVVQTSVPVNQDDGEFVLTDEFDIPVGTSMLPVRAFIVGFPGIEGEAKLLIPGRTVAAAPVIHREDWKVRIEGAEVQHTPTGEVRVTVRGSVSDGHGGFVLGGAPDGLGGVLPPEPVKLYRDGIDTGRTAPVANADGRFSGTFTFTPATGANSVKVGAQIIGSPVADATTFPIPEKPAVAAAPVAKPPRYVRPIGDWSDDGRNVIVSFFVTDEDENPCAGTVRVISSNLKGVASGFQDFTVPAAGCLTKTIKLRRADDLRVVVVECASANGELKHPDLGTWRR